MPAVSERQRKFLGAEIARKNRGEPSKTHMSTAQLGDFASGNENAEGAKKNKKSDPPKVVRARVGGMAIGV